MPFDGRLLAGITVLAAVVQGRSFVRAGEALGITTSGVSRSIARLEQRLGIRLLDRTPRSVALTDEGKVLRAGGTSAFHDRGCGQLGLRIGRRGPGAPPR